MFLVVTIIWKGLRFIMSNIIIVLILVLAIKGSLKHFKGEGGCCGGGSSVKVRDKKLEGPVIGKITLKVEGMHCENCSNRVKRTINSIDGASCKVNLRKGLVTIKYDREIDRDVFVSAIENLDYQVRS